MLSILLASATIVNRYLLYKLSKIKIENDINTVAIGDSHIQTSINPSIVSGCINLSRYGESYYYAYYKLKAILRDNNGITSVIIGFSDHNINMNRQDRSTTMPQYYILIDDGTINKLVYPSITFAFNYLKYKIGVPLFVYEDLDIRYLTLLGKLQPAQAPYSGQFYMSEKTILDRNITRDKIEHHYNKNKQYSGLSDFMLEYLKKIADMCFEKNIKLFLLATPLHHSYSDEIPEQARYDFDKSVLSILELRKNVYFIDFRKIRLEDSFFGDADHVNAAGAKIVSGFMDKILKGTIVIPESRIVGVSQ
jgi:hypothetical protein